MNKLRYVFAGTIALAALLLLGLGTQSEAAPSKAPLVNVIIGFNSTPGASEEALVHGLGGQISHRYSIVPGMAAAVPEAAITALRQNPNVAAVDLDGEVRAIDAELTNSWGVAHIGSGQVHDGNNSGLGIKLAVIDSGIGNGTTGKPHPDLAVVGGYDFVDGDATPQDGYGHGTHVAGTACALDNNVGVVGVAPGCALINLRVLDNSGSGSWSNILAAIEWAAANGVQIANLSLGGSQYPGATVETGFANAASSGLVIVAAAGNSGSRRGNNDTVGYPARFNSVIAVAATDQSDNRASFSSTGPDVEISAPGVTVNSTVPTGSCAMCSSSGYRSASGTSMAAPHVAGVAALMLAAGVTNVRTELGATAIPLGSAWQYGAGLVDAPGAVHLGATPPPTPSVGSVSGTVSSGGAGIAGATVNLSTGQTTSTGFDGTYSFADVPVGSVTVAASMTGYVSQQVTVEVVDGEDVSASFVLAVAPPLEVKSIDYSTSGGRSNDRNLDVAVLVEEDATPVEGVLVAITLYRDGIQYGSATATTGADGRARFRATRAPSGSYRTDVTSLNGGPNLTWDAEAIVFEKS